MRVTRFDHITIAVRDLDAAIETFSRCFNLKAKDRRRVKHLGMENVFLPFGDGAIELAAPLKDGEAADHVQRFLERRGEGMMNLCLTVEDMDAAIAHLKMRSSRPGLSGRGDLLRSSQRSTGCAGDH